MIKGIIFDLDGVICFTDKLHFAAWKQAVEPLGIAFDEETNDKLRGVSREQSLEIILRQNSVTLPAERKAAICRVKNEIYKSLLCDMSPADVESDVRQTLTELNKLGIKLAVGSSSKNTKFILRRLDLTKFFDAVVDGEMILRTKPDPEVFLKAAELLCLSPCDCLVVEDAVSGIDAGNAGGFVTVGIGAAANYSATRHPIRKLSEVLTLVQ